MLYMTITKIQILLLCFVVVFMIQNTNIIEGLKTYKWAGYGNRGTQINIIDPSKQCGKKFSGLTNVTYCGIVSDPCFTESGLIKKEKQEGASCSVNGIPGKCHDVSGKLLCTVNSNNINKAVTKNISDHKIYDTTSIKGRSFYAIKKNKLNKTHSAACIDKKYCNTLINELGSIDCSGKYMDCCLCNQTKWNKIYTSKWGDQLDGDSKPLNELKLFSSYDKTPPPGMNEPTTRDQYKVIKVNPSFGLITDISSTGGDFKRYFPIKKYVNNEAPLDKDKENGPNYSVSRGFFLDGKNELHFDLKMFPGYIQSDKDTQLRHNFYYEQCLYKKDPKTGKCICSDNSVKTKNKTKNKNPLCSKCPKGQVSNHGACVPCSDTNKVYNGKKCSPCNTLDAGNRRVYREDTKKKVSGKCIPINKVGTADVIRSDCVGYDFPKANCNVYSYGSVTSDVPLYHLSNTPTGGPTLDEFYAACDKNKKCHVVQSLVGTKQEASIENYVNFYEPPQYPKTTSPTSTHPPTLKPHNPLLPTKYKRGFNMVTNEYCRDITDQSKCNQLKQCNWYPNKGAISGLSANSGAKINKGTCMIDPKYNSYKYNGITYHFIPIPDYTPLLYNGRDTVFNYLNTTCEGRLQSECKSANKCEWISGKCVSYCNSKKDKNSCKEDVTCEWSGKSCSKIKDNSLSCKAPPITASTRYKNISGYGSGLLAFQEIFNTNVACRSLFDDPKNVEYSGDAKGFCFSGNSIGTMEKTGCIPSHIMNNLTLHKSPSKIITAAKAASTVDANILPNRDNIKVNYPNYTITSNNYIGSAPNKCSYYNSCLTTSETLPTLSPPSKPVTQTMNPTPIQSNTVIPYTELSNAPYLINRCRELCIKNPTICDDYGVKFPTSLNANTDEGCYLMKRHGSLNTALISVTFDPPIVLHFGVTYYPCSIKLKKKPGEKTLPDNIKNVVGVIGTNTHPLDIPYIYRLYGGIKPINIQIKTLNINIPGPSMISVIQISSGSPAKANKDTVSIYRPRCTPTTASPTEAQKITCVQYDTNNLMEYNLWINTIRKRKNDLIGIYYAIKNRFELEEIKINIPKRRKALPGCGSGAASSCSVVNSNKAPDVTNIKQFKLGKSVDNVYLYNIPTPGSAPAKEITQIATLIPGTTLNKKNVPAQGKPDIVWGNINDTTPNSVIKKRAATLIRPNKITTNNGGILKQNHSKNESTDDIEIMKLYILEGSSSIKFNLIGKRLPDAAGAARPDWKIENIVLPIQPDPQKGVRNYTAEFVISDL